MTMVMTNVESVKNTHYFFSDEQIIQYEIASCRSVIASICDEVSTEEVTIDLSCDLIDGQMGDMLTDLFLLA